MCMVQTCACQFTFLYFRDHSLDLLCTSTYVITNTLLKIKMCKQKFTETKEIKYCIHFFLEVRGFRVLVSVLCRSYAPFIDVGDDDDDDHNNNHIRTYKETTVNCCELCPRKPVAGGYKSRALLGRSWLPACQYASRGCIVVTHLCSLPCLHSSAKRFPVSDFCFQEMSLGSSP